MFKKDNKIMAKKKKAFIKLNTTVKGLLDGLPFDEGIVNIDTPILKGLVKRLDIKSGYHRADLIRSLRRVWSEADYRDRNTIVKFLSSQSNLKSSKKYLNDTKSKIEFILKDIDLTKQEEFKIMESFATEVVSRVTKEKILGRLSDIRLDERLNIIEKKMNIIINSNNIEFYSSYKFEIFQDSFDKELLTTSKNIDILKLLVDDDDTLIENLKNIQLASIQSKKQEIEEFVESLDNHKYLTSTEIIYHIKKAPVDIDLYHIPLDIDIFSNLVSTKDYKIENSYQSNQLTIIKKDRVEIFGIDIDFNVDISYTKNFLSGVLWRGLHIPFDEDFSSVVGEKISEFKLSIDTLYQTMQDEADGLEIADFAIENFILETIIPIIESTKKLQLKEKHKRGVLYNFNEYIKPLKAQKLREELLAKSIRDFKSLFPMARDMQREIIFHVGPTNSGKTYQAMKILKSASTGYYLAPLRLLALEGYEELKRDGVGVSLITGEEEIIDEDSTHICSTIEMLNNSVDVDVCLIDEIQMINDRDRGWAWTNALIGAPASKVIVTGSIDALDAVKEICEYLGEKLTIIEFERKNELRTLTHPTSLDNIEKATAIVAFSRRDVLSLKQQLSQKYSVSVIYGNLSPEVRREEARRFREGESQVLVSTDAIAMGLNLPIKTLIFAKDNKFDGLRRRELTVSEVLQISGRAGRYGLEDVGFVGALNSSALTHISKSMDKPLPKILPPFSIMASLEHVLLIGEILDTQNISRILEFFADNMEFDGPFVAGNIDSMQEVAQIVDDYELDLISKYHLSCAPASISSPYIENKFNHYIKMLSQGEKVRYIPPRDMPKFAITNEMMLDAEDRVREISLYLWLSFKFPEQFKDTEKAINSRVILNNFIEASLKKGELSKRCTKCGTSLDFSYKFSICDNCFNKRRRGYRRGGRR
ncbi:Helicase-like [hydrothermal vent metagenome]|uniref:Helicase-like n=1 Tax=hydrothermal vent metagenome TaxID=652676 RepID=A0A1W1ELD1_9ZZZZ